MKIDKAQKVDKNSSKIGDNIQTINLWSKINLILLEIEISTLKFIILDEV